jgi:lysozyme
VVESPAVVVGVGMSKPLGNYTKFMIYLVGGLVALIVLGGGVYMYRHMLGFIRREEGERLTKYRDIAGNWTIGIGHKILPGENLDKITQEQSAALFEKDMARIAAGALPAIKKPLNDNQKTAVLSLAFNVGAEAVAASTLVKKINAGDMAGAAGQFLVWDKITKNGAKVSSPALAARRGREKALFLS